MVRVARGSRKRGERNGGGKRKGGEIGQEHGWRWLVRKPKRRGRQYATLNMLELKWGGGVVVREEGEGRREEGEGEGEEGMKLNRSRESQNNRSERLGEKELGEKH